MPDEKPRIVNIRDSDAFLLTHLRKYPGWGGKGNRAIVDRLLTRGLVESYNEGNAHGMVRVTQSGLATLTAWQKRKGLLG